MGATAGLTLEVVEGPDAGLKVALPESLVVGRDSSAQLVLDDTRVSRRHASITLSGGEAVVEDLGSSNGTYLNHSALHAPARLRTGDELLIGTSVLALRTPEDVRSRPSAVVRVPPGLATPERPPTYVKPAGAQAYAPTAKGPPDLGRLLDVRTRAQARLAPVAMIILVALALVLYFGLR